MKKSPVISILIMICLLVSLEAKKKENGYFLESKILSGLKFRSIGPSFTSGRISDFAVNPANHSEYYVASSSGHVWKTINGGITWKPIFDHHGAYSIGFIAMAPSNPHILWVGTGENNHQRALGYGNGVYKSLDGGQSWKNMGLKESRHIGGIIIHPGNPDIVYVAAEGSAWGPGGDRGLYKTTDGGESWTKILQVSEDTGVNCIAIDPRDPQLLYASSEQRRRHVHTKIGGGPETAIYKTTDGGKTFRKLTRGLPTVDMGGIGLDVSPANPDVVYAIIEAAEGKGGFFCSTDRGESWEKRSSYTSSGQYYNEIFCDPKDVNKVYSVETVSKVTLDGGRTFRNLGLDGRHVDDHALWIDPADTSHFLIGGDGGVYETFDDGRHWRHIPNLPVTQFYRVAVDQSKPFYYVYGGTQDNNSMGGPSRTTASGIPNSEWFITKGGDGFFSQIDPENPNIIYAESQYGNIIRYDRQSGERTFITPQPRKDEKTYKWNWNTPLIISPHDHQRLYCAANKVFRSDDRGNSWKVISGDLTAGLDRNTWKVMGKYWSSDAVAKDVSTSQYGTIVSIDESPVEENLVIIGTDDGVIQITRDTQQKWTRIDQFPGVPPRTYVSDVMASRYDSDTIFASFDNRKRDDFTPYILISTDRGKSWKSIVADLPEEGTVHTLAQDYQDENLLFAGTEFGIFVSLNMGQNWIRLKNGIPDIPVRDIDIQEEECDLVLATFGRGFYILDDYAPLRSLSPSVLKKEAALFPVADSYEFIQTGNKYGQGSDRYLGENQPFGAIITYYLKEAYQTDREKRRKEEKELFKDGKKIEPLSWAELREEKKEEPPHLIFTIKNDAGITVRQLRTRPGTGIQRIVWDLQYPASAFPPELKKERYNPLAKIEGSYMVLPGKYSVSLAKSIKGKITSLDGPREFTVKALDNTTLPAENRRELVAFQEKVNELARVMTGIRNLAGDSFTKVEKIKQALLAVPSQPQDLIQEAKKITEELDEIIFILDGFEPKASFEEIPPAHMPLVRRVRYMYYYLFSSTSAPTNTHKMTYQIVTEELKPLKEKLSRLVEKKIPALEEKLDKAGAPYTPGRLLED